MKTYFQMLQDIDDRISIAYHEVKKLEKQREQLGLLVGICDEPGFLQQMKLLRTQLPDLSIGSAKYIVELLNIAKQMQYTPR